MERKHRHIVETGLTLLAHASVPFRFWSDALTTACFLINRTPTRVLNMKTPLEVLLNEQPDYTFFKVFGCACWPHLRPYNKRKLEFRSKKCVFLGYSSLHKGYKCLHVPTNRVYISRDVVFDEQVFPFAKLPVSTAEPLPLHSSSVASDQFDDIAYSPILLPNHGAGTGRGARLEILEEPSSPPDDREVSLHGLGDRAHAHRAEPPPTPTASAPPAPGPAPLISGPSSSPMGPESVSVPASSFHQEVSSTRPVTTSAEPASPLR